MAASVNWSSVLDPSAWCRCTRLASSLSWVKSNTRAQTQMHSHHTVALHSRCSLPNETEKFKWQKQRDGYYHGLEGVRSPTFSHTLWDTCSRILFFRAVLGPSCAASLASLYICSTETIKQEQNTSIRTFTQLLRGQAYLQIVVTTCLV